DFVKRSNRHMQSISNVLAMKDAPRHVTFGKYRRLFGQFDLLETFDEFQVRRTMRLTHSIKFTDYERRNYRAILGQFVLPPAHGQVAPKRFAIVEIGSDD